MGIDANTAKLDTKKEEEDDAGGVVTVRSSKSNSANSPGDETDVDEVVVTSPETSVSVSSETPTAVAVVVVSSMGMKIGTSPVSVGQQASAYTGLNSKQ